MRKRFIALLLAGALAVAGLGPVQAAEMSDGIREAGDAAAAAAGAAFDNTEYTNARTEAESEKTAAEARLAEAEASLRALEEQQRQVAGEIDEKNASLVDLLVSISQTNDEIAEADKKVTASEKTIAATQKKLTKAEKERDGQYRAMKRRIQYFYENAYPLGIFGILLNGGSGSPIDRMEQLLSLEEADRDAYQSYQNSVQEILLLKEKLGEERKVFDFEKKTLEAREASLEAQKKELAKEIRTLKNSDADYENRIAQVEEQAKVITDLIQVQSERLKTIEAAEAAARKAAEEAARKAAEEAARKAAEEAARKAAEEAARKEAERKAAEEAARKAAEEKARKKQSEVEAARQVEEAAKAAEQRAAEKRAADEALRNLEGQTAASQALPIETPPTPTPAVLSGEALGRKIVEYADQFVGCPYVWGGNSLTNGCDCSHFVHLVLLNCGAYSGGYMTSGYWPYAGQPVNSLAEARAGDIVCYSGHVGIYDGAGLIVEARGSAYGIVHYRPATCKPIVAIRRFT